ncbi:MAG: phosphate ABC transporter substrate-binding/OmpA family protein [Pseudomonadota bacterium]
MSAVSNRNIESTEEKSNLVLIDRLWRLKKACEKKLFLYIQLNRLIKDVEYRQNLMSQAKTLNDQEINQLIAEIESVEDALRESTGGDIGGIAAVVTDRRIGENSKRLPLFQGAVFLFLLSIAIATYILWFTKTGSTDNQKILPVNNAPIKLRVHGSNSVGEKLVPALLEAYFTKQEHKELGWKKGLVPVERQFQVVEPNNTIFALELHAHGSSTGFKDLLDGTTDIAMSSRKIKEREAEALLASAGDMLSHQAEHIVALDGVAVVTYPNNPIDDLTIKQLARLFSGEITNWRELGGQDMPVSIYARDKNSGTWDTFKNLVLKPQKRELALRARRYESSSEMSDQVATNRGAIGFIGLPYVRNAKLLAVSSIESSLPIMPTSFTVSTEDYPLSRRLYIYTPPELNNVLAMQIVNFALSRDGQNVAESLGLASQNIKMQTPLPADSASLRYIRLTENAQRLSVNFRFDYKTDQLDNKSLRDLERLVDFMSENSARKLMLFGFSDDVGERQKNQALSLRRAEIIEKAMNSRGVAAFKVEGFGESMPLASNDTYQGRVKNRRVEAWVL